MVQKAVKKLFFFSLILFIVLNIFLGVLGISSVFLTLSMYLSISYALIKLVSKLAKDPEKKSNYTVLVAFMMVSLFASELILKYGTKSFLNYSEKNGIFYYSDYKKDFLVKMYRKIILKEENASENFNFPNSQFNIKNREFSYSHLLNSIGLRNIEPIIDSNLISIVCLGDSFMEGVGAPGDSTWVNLLGENMSKRKEQVKIQMINGGIKGSDPISEYVFFENNLLKYKPKLLIVAINDSDVGDVIVRGGFERYNSSSYMLFSKGPWWEFIYSYSYLFRGVVQTFFDVNYLLLTPNQYEKERKAAVEKLKTCIENYYSELAIKNNIKLAVVLHPMQYEVEGMDFGFHSLSANFRNNKSFLLINLFEEYCNIFKEKERLIKTIYWQVDLHHNSLGYKLWADILTQKLNPLLLKLGI